MSRKDLTGQRFGRLTVIRATEQRASDGTIVYECLCDCGNACYAHTGQLTRKGPRLKRSCGCLLRKHGDCKSRLYMIWKSMKGRCYTKNQKYYSYYGGRGITVCAEWKNDFAAFRKWALSAGYNDGLSLDRIDVDGNYCPENCRWATWSEQQNNKRINRKFEYDGKTHTLAEWAKIAGVSYNTLTFRINDGWTIERALTQPVRKRKK